MHYVLLRLKYKIMFHNQLPGGSKHCCALLCILLHSTLASKIEGHLPLRISYNHCFMSLAIPTQQQYNTMANVFIIADTAASLSPCF